MTLVPAAPTRPTIELLADVPLFESLSRAHLGRLSGLATRSEFPEGKVVVARGEPGRAFYVIVEGAADVVSGPSADGRVEATLRSGEFFGELSLLDGEARSATVVAATPLTVVRIERTAFRRLLRQEPDLALKLLEAMARRTRAIMTAPAL